jgi:HSP20 family protein
MANMTRWDPWSEFVPLRQMMDRLFEDAWLRPSGATGGSTGAGSAGSGFAFDLYETPEDYVVNATVPGLRPEDLELTVQGMVLTISGEIKPPAGAHSSAQYQVRERQYGRFSRQFHLPLAVDPDRIQAHLEHGILTVHLPKAEAAKPRRIEIQGGSSTMPQLQATTSEPSTA